MQNFRELKVWGKSHQLSLQLYPITRKFPKEELYGIISQIRRAAISISTNIAEGCCRNSDADFARFLNMALGSASELEYLLLLSQDLAFLDSTTYSNLTESVVEIKRMLTTFIQKLRADG